MSASISTVNPCVSMIADPRGLAAAQTERMVADGPTIEIIRVKITDGGRRAPATPPQRR
jgi:hypothetical protein